MKVVLNLRAKLFVVCLNLHKGTEHDGRSLRGKTSNAPVISYCKFYIYIIQLECGLKGHFTKISKQVYFLTYMLWYLF